MAGCYGTMALAMTTVGSPWPDIDDSKVCYDAYGRSI